MRRIGTYLNSVTRLGDICKFLVTKFLSKEAQIFGYFLGYFEKRHFLCRNCFINVLGSFLEYWAIFKSNIWSHCLPTKRFMKHFSSIFIAACSTLLKGPEWRISMNEMDLGLPCVAFYDTIQGS